MVTFKILYNSLNLILEPSNDSIVFVKQRTENIFRVSIQDKLIFEKEFFSPLWGIKNSVNRCDKVMVEVLSNGVYTGVKGYLSLSKAVWNEYKCRVAVQFVLDDLYSCVKKLNKLQVNTLEADGNITTKTFIGELEYQDVIVDGNNFFLSSPSLFVNHPSGNGWIGLYYKFTNLVVNSDSITYSGRLTTTFVRVNNGDTYSSPIIVLNSELSSNSVVNGMYNQIYEVVGGIGFPNGRTLYNIIQKYLSKSECGLNFRSNFLGINTNGNYPNNTAYQYSENFKNIIVHQKSDIKRPYSLSKASKNIYTFENFIEELKSMFNLELGIEGDTLILEHVSYFSVPNNTILDISNIDVPDEEESDNNQPYRMVFKYMDDTSFNFDSSNIVFSEACSGEDLDTEEIIVKYANNDIQFIVGNTEKISDSGMVFLVTDFVGIDFVIKKKETTVGGSEFVNGHFAWNNLIKNLWLYNQYENSFMLGTEIVNAYSVKPRITFSEVKIRMCFDEFLNINPNAGRVLFGGYLCIIESMSWVNDVTTLKLKR